MTYLEPLKVQSLKDACVNQMERLILSGEYAIGEKLPSERDLAASLGISRPVLHEALVDLAAKGLVEISPRRGIFISDYSRTGSFALLESLLKFNGGRLDPRLIESLFEMRLLIETEDARLAAFHCTPDQLHEMQAVLQEEAAASRQDAVRLAGLDFTFHQLLAIASANRMYSLILNSFEPVYTHLTIEFYKSILGSPPIEEVFAFHRRLVDAIAAADAPAAVEIIRAMLNHGMHYIRLLVDKTGPV
jgi:GntR family transcriptional regulator, transcriptional repressor for pyruvate dehydrogenase complex